VIAEPANVNERQLAAITGRDASSTAANDIPNTVDFPFIVNNDANLTVNQHQLLQSAESQ